MPKFPIRYTPPPGFRWKWPKFYRRDRFGKFIWGLSMPEWGFVIFMVGGITYGILDTVWRND